MRLATHASWPIFYFGNISVLLSLSLTHSPMPANVKKLWNSMRKVCHSHTAAVPNYEKKQHECLRFFDETKFSANWRQQSAFWKWCGRYCTRARFFFSSELQVRICPLRRWKHFVVSISRISQSLSSSRWLHMFKNKRRHEQSLTARANYLISRCVFSFLLHNEANRIETFVSSAMGCEN